ncbi:MAG TPA: 30S ribosomal protein S20 [Candidatus Magasanikbacteria bacterium]|nr:MAG: 30S ribosomal protein S20 [Candidatus Magasanikbacteria bacterium RIFOXYC2_FULL_39_8]HAT04013.1 30S ribosomal protein S20 [Candidatus Magasanikbacteria bacterium]
MPILRNAKKALRQSKKHEAENLIVKKAYKEALKNARKAVQNGAKDIDETIKLVQKKLDKAAKKGVIKKNTAGRYLSRLTKSAKKVAKK